MKKRIERMLVGTEPYNIVFFGIVLLLASCKTRTTSTAFNKLELKEGYQLNYNLAFGGERYQFIVDMVQIDSNRVFDYTMTNKGHTNARITLRKEALDTAKHEKNTFNGYDDTLSSDQLTIWLSRKVMKDLIQKDTAWFHDGKQDWSIRPKAFYNAGFTSYQYELNGFPQSVEVLVVQQVDGDSVFWILNDMNNPLIIKMEIDFTIWLKEINYSL